MNRQQRRKSIKRGVTVSDLKQEQLDGIRFAVRAYSVAVAMVLHDKLRFGDTKLKQTINQIQDLFDSVSRDYITIADLEETLLEDCGISFQEGGIKCESTKTIIT